MDSPSKESILVLRRFLATPQIKEILNHLRANPPRTVIDPAFHVYAHSAGVRQGWTDLLDELDRLAEEKPEPRIQRDTIES